MRHRICRLLAGFVILSLLSAGLLETAEAAHGHAEGAGDRIGVAPGAHSDVPDTDSCDSSCHAAGHLVGLVKHGALTLPVTRTFNRHAHVTRHTGRDSPPPTPPPNI